MAQCQSDGAGCGSSSDCCQGLVCSGGTCGAALCRGLGAPCAGTPDCCNPFLCVGGICSAQAQCGQQSQACTNTNDCCNPFICSGGQCTSGQLSSLTWNVSNTCYNGEDVRYRFFDETDSLTWPDNQTAYLINAGQTLQSIVACKAGNTLCIGADQPMHNLSYGVNIDNTLQCQQCCFVCQDGAVGQMDFACN